MRRQLRLLVCAVAVAGAVAAAQAPAPPADGAPSSLTLWYRQAAPQWDHAMPVGNGRLGAMVFGSVNRERIQLNEHSLWMGGRQDRNSPEALKYLPEVRRLLFAGAPGDAYALAERHLMGRPQRLQSYQTLGDVRLIFDHEDPISDYRRELDLDSAIVRVTYRAGALRLTREIFASHPDQAIVVRLSAADGARLSTSVWIERSQDATTQVVGSDTLNLVGQLAGGKGLAFQASVKVLPAGGKLETFPERILIDRATSVTLLIAANTSFRGGDPAGMTARHIAAAASKQYEQLRHRHVTDHQQLFRRAGLRLGTGDPAAGPSTSSGQGHPTDERLERVKRGGSDPGLESLYFQFGRYLLIASSRPGGLPANLQGLWNDSMNPPWDSDYHLNINLQMNYWPAEVTNLAETHLPLFEFLDSLREPGRITARVHYGARGFVAHHITDVWGFTSPGDLPRSGLWPTGAAWLTQHLWEHYRFNLDRT